MNTKNFIIDDDIYIVFEGNHFDLHNDYDFTGYEYSVDACRLSLSWKIGTGDWVRDGQPPSLRLDFEGVSYFEVKPRNPELPHTEDSCLDGFYFISNEDWCDGSFSGPDSGSLKELPPNCKHYIQFMSEADMILLAEVCTLHFDKST